MKILRVRADGFGVFSGEVRLAPDRLNVVCGANESGKTTLAAALTAALYGLDSDARGYRGRFTPRQQFEPWSGRPYAVEVGLEAGGKRFTVNRHFGRGSATVFEEGRGDVTEDFRHGLNEYMIGEGLLELSVEQFSRSALWLQEGPGRLGGADVRPDGSLSARLETHASSVAGDASAQAAIEVLEGALEKYPAAEPRLQVGNFIRRLETQLETKRSDLEKDTQRLESAALALGQLGRTRDEERRLEADRQRAAWHALSIGLAETEILLERDAEARQGLEERRAELARLRTVPPIPEGAADRLRQAQAERQEAENTLEELATRRAATVDGPRRAIEAGIAAAGAVAWSAPVHLEEIAALEREFARLHEGRGQAEKRRVEVEADLRRAGVRVDRLEALRARFAGLAPADAGLLGGAPASMQAWATESEKAERAAGESSDLLAGLDRERQSRRVSGLALVGAGLSAGAGAVWLALSGRVGLSFAGLAATFVALAAGIVLVVRAAAHRAAERQTVLRALADARRRLQALKEQAAERTLALADLAGRLGMLTSAGLLEEHAEYLRVVREGDRLGWIGQDLERLTGEEAALRARAWQWAARAGLVTGSAAPGTSAAPAAPAVPAAGWDALAALARVREAVSEVLALRGQGERLEALARDFAAQEEAARARRERAGEAAREVVRALGTPEDDWERALAEVDGRRQAMERLRVLEPAVADFERQVLPAMERDARETARDQMRAERARLGAEHPQWAGETLPATITRAEIEGRGRELERELESVRARRVDLERDVGWLDDSARGGVTARASELRLGIAELEREGLRARRFQQAVEHAHDRLQAVARETNARWAEFVSGRVNDLLPVLGPAYRGFELTDKLDYSLVIEGQRLERERLDQVLSAGARDQLHLAVRLAVCEFLSRGREPLPLVLDDPFAAGDDERAEAGLRFLAETVAGGHQVVLLTCHRARLESMRERDPGWFAGRVNWVEMPGGAGDSPGGR